MVNRNGRRLSVTAVFFLLLSLAGTARAQRKTDWSPLDHFIHESMKQWQVPGAAVAIVHGKSVVYLHGFGVRDIRTGEAVTPDTLFDIGSCTKAFTSASVAMLVDQGKMRWDGKVRDYIPFFHLYNPLADEYVTMRDLLTHRTGVPGTDLLWYGAPYTREEIVRRMVYAKPNAGFRARFQYQNVMYVVAGYAVGQVSGGTWDEFVKQHIFDPLGMTDSDTSSVAAQRSPNYATPHVEEHGKVTPIPWRNIDDAGPAGSINSSVRDMAKWITFQLGDGTWDGKRLISAKNMHEMHTPQMVVTEGGDLRQIFFPDAKLLSYGLGWFIEDYRGHELILHPGDIDGFSAMVVLIPDLDTGYVVLVNLSSFYRQVLGYHIADELLDLPSVDWSTRFGRLAQRLEATRQKRIAAWQAKRAPHTHTTLALSAYAGTYNNKLYGHATVALDDAGKLVLQFHGFAVPLAHYQYDTFLVSLRLLGEHRLTFSLDADGDVSQFTVAGIKFRREGKPSSSGAAGN